MPSDCRVEAETITREGHYAKAAEFVSKPGQHDSQQK